MQDTVTVVAGTAGMTCLQLLLFGCQSRFLLSYSSFPVSYTLLLTSHNSIHLSLQALSFSFSTLSSSLQRACMVST